MPVPVPIEYLTVHAVKESTPSSGVRIVQDKLGREIRVDRAVVVKFQTRLHASARFTESSGTAELPSECLKDGGCPCGVQPGVAQMCTIRRGIQQQIKVPEGGLREAQIRLIVMARMYENALRGVHTFNMSGLGHPASMPLETSARLHTEILAVLKSLGPDVDRARARIEKSRVKRLTGPGAEERILKLKEKLQMGLGRVPHDLDATIILQLICLHVEFVCLSIPKGATQGFSVLMTSDLLEAVKRPGMPPLEKLLHQADLWLGGAARTAPTVHGIPPAQAAIDFLQHAANNPRHVELLKLEHVQEAIDMASVASVMER